MFSIHIIAPNDPNGNPRRLYLVCGPHGPLAAVDEGYSGFRAIAEAGFPNAPEVWNIEVSASEYKRLKKQLPAKKSSGRAREAREAHGYRRR